MRTAFTTQCDACVNQNIPSRTSHIPSNQKSQNKFESKARRRDCSLATSRRSNAGIILFSDSLWAGELFPASLLLVTKLPEGSCRAVASRIKK